MKENVILYHANCTDGFGGAYAAWKKFGENASYIPVFHGEPFPEDLDAKNVFIIDFSYDRKTNLEIKNLAKKLTIIDHHKMREFDVEIADESIFDTSKSGAHLAWEYFHPNTKVPKLIKYIQEGDLYEFKLPNSKEILAVIHLQEHSFENFSKLHKKLESNDGFEEILIKGTAFKEHWDYLVQRFIEEAELVTFEGFTVFAVNVPGPFRSDVGNKLAEKHPPLSVLWRSDAEYTKISLRSKGVVDVAEIAQKYGGGGHPNAASFRIKNTEPLPFKKV